MMHYFISCISHKGKEAECPSEFKGDFIVNYLIAFQEKTVGKI